MNNTYAESAKYVNQFLKVTLVSSLLISPKIFGPLYFMVTMVNHL